MAEYGNRKWDTYPIGGGEEVADAIALEKCSTFGSCREEPT